MIEKKMKKKRQAEPCGDIDNESTESCDDNQNKSTCNHSNKAVDLPKLKKSLKAGLDTECAECSKNSSDSAGADGDYEYDLSLWLCLKCGNQGCGRAKKQHALKHFEKPHSDCHALCVNTTSWLIWCYECDNEVSPNSKKKLLEVYEYIKKQSTPRSSPRMEPVVIETTVEGKPTPIDMNNKKVIPNLPRVRGLSNLGNTCFFNAVLQCLAQTPFLLPVLKEMAEEGEKFRLPGGPFKFNDATQDLPAIEGELSSWGALTEVLANTLQELQDSGGVITPRHLLSLLSHKMPQFGGGDQEDSHELLRHLLEAVRNEDLKRYQCIILNELGYSKKTDPSTVDDEPRQKIKFYGLQASDMMLRPEQVFRGILVSTLQCQDCQHTSTRDESFLDLSLPVMPDKPQPPVMRRKTEYEEDKPSKHQLKKEKKAQRKGRKNKTGNKPHNEGETITEFRELESGQADNNSESEQSDADVEDNLDDAAKLQTTPDEKADCSITEKVDSPEIIDKTSPELVHVDIVSELNIKNLSSGSFEPHSLTGQEAVGNGPMSFTNSTNNCDPCSNDPSMSIVPTLEEVTNRLTGGAENAKDPEATQVRVCHTSSVSPNASPNSSECSELSSLDQNPTTESRNDVSPDDCSSATAPKSLPSMDEMFRISLEKNLACAASPAGDSPKISPSENLNIIALGWHEDVEDPPSPARINSPEITLPAVISNVDESKYLYLPPLRDSWSTTIGARYQCDDGECSIQSCLNQFTSVELMTGNNKVCCEACTKRINGREGKNVYTNSTKQLLIANPPAVLILHLKRFQVFRSLFRKMSKPVTFPLVLDLAPFCSNKYKNLPTINQQQSKLLYSLYGVVEHSGTLHGGHYVAYVKVRATLDKNDSRWQFLPRGGKTALSAATENCKVDKEMNANNEGAAGISDPEPPPGKWYYVSDSQVNDVDESRVLKAQAYLLFYERIL